MEPVIRFIGEIHSVLKSPEDCPLQEYENAPAAVIKLSPEFAVGIKDIHAGAEIVLLTWLHRADRSVLTCIPRRAYGSPLIGVFSTRSPDRPNPIGIHMAKVTSVANDTLNVSGLEVIDGTPLLDIKPLLKRSIPA